jgi:paraquat-inducible protein A
MQTTDSIITCHDCDLVQKSQHLPEEGTLHCYRCAAVLRKRRRIKPDKSIEHTLALVITALVLFVMANAFPIIQLRAEGHELTATLIACIAYLFTHNMLLLAGLVFLTCIGAPLIQLTGLLYILLPLNFNCIPWFAPQIYRIVRSIGFWSMLEVLMLGILVSIVKLSALAAVIPGIALWAFGLLIFVIAAILNDLDTEILWQLISPKTQSTKPTILNGKQVLANCHNCNLLCHLPNSHSAQCPRCSSTLHLRKPQSQTRSTALLLAAIIMFFPANLLPVMEINSLGKTEGDTIMSGVIHLAMYGDWSLALILFIASICVPLLKLLILSVLLISVQIKSQWRPKERTQLYRLTEIIGHWSMVDIFVATLMAALIQIQGLMTIEVGAGAVAFGSVVVLTMLATKAFDPRLIWDNMEKINE